jgi:hypothetical protein
MSRMDHTRSASDLLTFDLGPRRAWVWLTLGVALLAVAESVGLAAIVHALLPALLAWVVDALIVLPTVGFVIVIGSALTGRVIVDADQLVLRFGLLGGARVPRADIARVERFVPALIRPIGLGIDLPFGSRQATVTRGGQVPYVRVLLERPTNVRTALWRRAFASELVMSTRSPDQLIAALV